MRNKRFFIVLVGALIFGVLAAVSVSKYLSSAQAYGKNLNKIAVAKVAIPIGSKIIPEQIIVVQFPKESTPDGAFDSPEKLAGRVAVMNIAAREPITDPFGFPLRLRTATKLGFKNAKWVMAMEVTNVFPSSYWADRGFNWYAGI